MKSVHLVLIDIQNSFMDYLAAGTTLVPYGNCDSDRMVLPDGTEFLSALPVPGALQDAENTIGMIQRLGGKISKITATYDTHPHAHIGHPAYWRDANGRMPQGMTTVVRADDVRNGILTPANAQRHVPQLGNKTVLEITLDYLDALEAKGRFHFIWNEHCVIGTWGHNLYAGLTQALKEWEVATGRQVNRLTKGSFMFAEHFGPFEAEVPNQYAPETQLQSRFITSLQNDDMVVFAGQARTHCMMEGIRQVFDNFDKQYLSKLWMLENAMSNIPAAGPGDLDFPAKADVYYNNIFAQGVNRTDTVSFLS